MTTPNTWILTRAGVKFDLIVPRPDMVRRSDIAYALARLVRFTGHGRIFYSVAEHSIHVADRVEDLGGSADDVRAALLHDAPEAYVGDASSPLKAAMRVAAAAGMSSYDIIEERVWCAIARAFNLATPELPAIVRQADHELLAIEAPSVFGAVPPEWGPLPDVDDAARVRHAPFGLQPCAAEAAYLDRLDRWFGGDR